MNKEVSYSQAIRCRENYKVKSLSLSDCARYAKDFDLSAVLDTFTPEQKEQMRKINEKREYHD